MTANPVFTVSGETLQILEAGGKPIRRTSSASNDVIDLTSDNEEKYVHVSYLPYVRFVDSAGLFYAFSVK